MNRCALPDAAAKLICVTALACVAPTMGSAGPTIRCDMSTSAISRIASVVLPFPKERGYAGCPPGLPRVRSQGEERFLRLDVFDRLVWLDCRREILSAQCRADPACEDRERDRYVPVSDHTGYLVARGCSQATFDERRRKLAAQ